MDSSFSVSPRRASSTPKPETGLAEWTSKIKALQRQVDADEEDEQKRLEEEIAAARQARLRRSRGGGSRADSIDLSNSREQIGMSSTMDDKSTNDGFKSSTERQNDQDSALRKLMGRNEVHNPDKVGIPNSGGKDPVSLAAFMGGRATGPRLNRHAPQQDAHDPTQFIQPNLSAPHPVFGQGGIAMPGMAARKNSRSPGPAVGSEMSERYQPSSVASAKFTSSPSPSVKPEAGEVTKAEKHEVHRRSFTGTPKSPNPALAARYAEKLDTPIRDVKPSPAPLLSTRRSFGSLPKSTSPLPSPSFAKKDEPTPRDTPTFTSKPSDSFRSPDSTPAASKPTSSFSSPTTTPTYSSIPPVSKTASPYTASSFTPSAPAPSKPVGSFSSPSFSANSPRNGATPSFSPSETPLRRLMERNHVFNPDAESTKKTVAERVQTTSLAAFMGAPGKGIRLNKHAPQQDAHDPTQFSQPDLSAPHPIFGKGGVAMPGMVPKKSPTQEPAGVDSSDSYRPSSTKKPSWPPVSSPQKVEDRPPSPQKTGNRERTISAPRADSSVSFSSSQSSGGWTPSRSNARASSPTKTPARDRTTSATPTTPSYLARPIQPEPKASSLSPQLPVAVASPAFQKPLVQKDLTPSLSRLQGRGFVQNRVKASSQFEATPPSPTLASADRSRPPSASGKKGSVLDRWQPNTQSSSPSPTPSYTNAMKRSTTFDPVSKSGPSPQMTGSSASSGGAHGLKSVASLPSLAKSAGAQVPAQVEDPFPRSRTPGLGSATTMVVIKPSKSFTDLKQLAHADELGIKPGQNSNPRTLHPDRTPSPRKPLIHSTKDRARKPKKNHDDRLLTDDDWQPLSQSPVWERPSEKIVQRSSLSISPLPEDHATHSKSPNVSPLPSPGLKAAKLSLISPSHSPTTAHSRARTPEASSPVGSGGPQSPVKEKVTPPSPSRHSRIPSTGNRLTVMELAQALSDLPEPEPELPSPIAQETEPSPVEPIARPRNNNLAMLQAEKRRSTYERYSAIILPPLKEEATPTPTPAGTLNRNHAPLTDMLLNGRHETEEPEPMEEIDIVEKNDDMVHFSTDDGPLIEINKVKVPDLLRPRHGVSKSLPDVQTISVEVLTIVANSATAINRSHDIFYDTEILSVIHRTKSKSSGLAFTEVWCWLGKQTRLGDREDKKLTELAKRYGTSPKFVQQLSEPPELVQVLGGRLAIRQGTRAHWTCENTTMHLVRFVNGIVLIDEYDLNIQNLCSAFSYCFTILGSIYVWHGCGSLPAERKAALEYAQTLSPDPVSPIELVEGETDDDEMFWMILGDDDFAKADYWRWRHSSSETDPLIWRVDPGNASKPVVSVPFISMEQNLQNSVYVMSCIWELFVVVGKNARGDRRVIRCAVDLAKKISAETAFARPHTPTVHVLILPSQLPLDLRLGIRDLNEAWLNDGEVPDHMNLLPHSEADNHLEKYSWKRTFLKDLDMLPLGVNASDIP